MSQFSERLKALRETMGLTQAVLAARLGIPVGTYKGYEAGRREPSLDVINQIARIVGINIDALIKDNKPVPESPTDALLYYLRGQELMPEDIELIHDLLEVRRLRRERARPPE